MTYRRLTLLLPPLAMAVLVAAAVALGLNNGAVALLAVASGVVCVVCLPAALTSSVRIEDRRLAVRGVPPYSSFNATATPVSLDRLTAAYTIHFARYGQELRGGSRTLVLEDSTGGRQRVPLTFVMRGPELKASLADAARRCGVTLDDETAAAIGTVGASDGSSGPASSRRVVSVRLGGPRRRR